MSNIISTFPTTLQNGTVEDATQVMTLFSWIQNQVNGNACGATSGSGVLKGDGSGNTLPAVAGVDFTTGAQVQNSSLTFLSSVAGTNTIVGTLTPAITAYQAGQMFSFISAGANTGAVTLNVNGVGAKSITKAGSTALAAGDITANTIIIVQYDGTEFQLVAPAALSGLGTMAFQSSSSVSITGGSISGVSFTGNITGNASGSSGSCTGNAATATLSTDSTNALGYNQTWQNVTGSRVLGTTYTNSTGKPIMLAVTGSSSTAGGGAMDIFINGTFVGRQGVNYASSLSSKDFIAIVIPNGATYMCQNSNESVSYNITLAAWWELR